MVTKNIAALFEVQSFRSYTLDCDVVNPNRDKRATDDASRLPFSQGDVWLARWVSVDRADPRDGLEKYCLELTPRFINTSRYNPRGRLILGWFKVNPDEAQNFTEMRKGQLLYDHDAVSPKSQWVMAFLDAMVLRDEDFYDVISRISGYPGDMDRMAWNILKKLHQKNKVSAQDMRDAYNDFNAEED